MQHIRCKMESLFDPTTHRIHLAALEIGVACPLLSCSVHRLNVRSASMGARVAPETPPRAFEDTP
jgi:hypothetical protein